MSTVERAENHSRAVADSLLEKLDWLATQSGEFELLAGSSSRDLRAQARFVLKP